MFADNNIYVKLLHSLLKDLVFCGGGGSKAKLIINVSIHYFKHFKWNLALLNDSNNDKMCLANLVLK